MSLMFTILLALMLTEFAIICVVVIGTLRGWGEDD